MKRSISASRPFSYAWPLVGTVSSPRVETNVIRAIQAEGNPPPSARPLRAVAALVRAQVWKFAVLFSVMSSALASPSSSPTPAAEPNANSMISADHQTDHTVRSPFGIAWFFLYGYSGVPAAPYMPALRGLGADFTKVYLFWQQIEPEKGKFDWTAVDAFANQLTAPEEGLISIFSASLWATEKSSAMLPPSPARNLDDYYHFVFATVKRCRGRVKYWENDAEPNNPVFWSGTKEQFVAQLKVFHRAVKDADPSAIVIAGGFDGLFMPPGMTPLPGQRAKPFPGQEVGLEFFDYVIREGAGAYDYFDLRLYGDPYTIVPRVEYMRSRMRAFDNVTPIICAEYGGPNFFEFPENQKYRPLISGWSAQATAAEKPKAENSDPAAHGGDGAPPSREAQANAPDPKHVIADMYEHMATLPPQTQMFMLGCAPELDAKYQRIQARSIVMRNVLALSAGVERLLYWDLLDTHGERDDLMTLMYAKIGLLGVEGNQLTKRTVSADAYARMTTTLAGVQRVTRLPMPEQPSLFLYQVDRGGRGIAYVVWERRDGFTGEDAPAVPCEWAADLKDPVATDALGATVRVECTAGHVRLPVSVTPIFVTEGAN